jgi:hypothetical protein
VLLLCKYINSFIPTDCTNDTAQGFNFQLTAGGSEIHQMRCVQLI